MKAFLYLLGVVTFPLQAQHVEITRLEREGTLGWTNRLCTTRPVYEVLSAQSLTGSWQRVQLITNQTSVAITNDLAGSAATRFYRIAWRDDAPVEFSYAFFQDLGEGDWYNSVTGRLSLAFYNQTATWRFDPVRPPSPGSHVTGVGQWLIRFPGTGNQLRIGGFSQYLLGTLETTNTVQGRMYSRFTGEVIQHGFAGDFAIGRFVAERLLP